MSLGVSLFTACGIYFQSTWRLEPNSLSSKNTRSTVSRKPKMKTQSCHTEGAFPGLSDLVRMSLQWKQQLWSYSVEMKENNCQPGVQINDKFCIYIIYATINALIFGLLICWPLSSCFMFYFFTPTFMVFPFTYQNIKFYIFLGFHIVIYSYKNCPRPVFLMIPDGNCCMQQLRWWFHRMITQRQLLLILCTSKLTHEVSYERAVQFSSFGSLICKPMDSTLPLNTT